jgi:hypothetical protein
LDTGLFDFEEASQGAGWIKELKEEHPPETEEYLFTAESNVSLINGHGKLGEIQMTPVQYRDHLLKTS